MKKSIIVILLLSVTVITSAQHILTDWQNITSKNFVSRIIHDQNYLYVGTMGGGLIKINKLTEEQTLLCRANGRAASTNGKRTAHQNRCKDWPRS